MSKKGNKHYYIIFNNGGIRSVASLKEWARGNRHHFDKQFISKNVLETPTTKEIEPILSELGYIYTTDSNVVIYYHPTEL